MEESAKRILKMKFAKLTMMLNGIFFLAALAILAFFGLIPIFSLQIAGVCTVITGILVILFIKHYRQDKAWLEAQKD
ncbi:MAG: hypothetical protein PHO78_01065 [Methanomicrobium sp.]|nr:hypothetical protein [Methanomicrobium sp.]